MLIVAAKGKNLLCTLTGSRFEKIYDNGYYESRRNLGDALNLRRCFLPFGTPLVFCFFSFPEP